MGDPPVDLQPIADETVAFLTLEADGRDTWVGEAPEWFGEFLFGGFVIAQAVSAAAQTAPPGRRIHSLHAYFLRPVTAGEPVSYRITRLRDGRSFAARQLVASQNGADALAMTCSFTADTEGYEYELRSASDVADPSALAIEPGPGPWIAASVGPATPDVDGTRTSTFRNWFRVAGVLPDDPHLHAALVAFATDWTGTGGRPLHLDGDTQGMVSLDHAVWFHRPARADEWLFYDVNSLINAGGRGLLRGTIHGLDGRLAVSVAQEMRLHPVGPA